MDAYRKEERMLTEASEERRRERRMPSAAQRSAAIRRGMNRAQSDTRRRKGVVFAGAGAAILAAGALLLGYGGGSEESPMPQEPTKQIRAEDMLKLDQTLEPFYKLVSRNDPTLSGAMQRKAVMAANIVDERDGFALAVRGMVRDSRSVSLFYTLKSPNGDRLSLADPELLNAADGGQATFDDYSRPSEEFDVFEQAQYGVITLPLLPKYGESERFTLKARAVSGRSDADDRSLQTFEVPLTLASTASEEEQLVFEQPKMFEVGGRKFAIDRVLITPLQIYLSVDEEKGESFSWLVNPRLVVTNGGQEQPLTKSALWLYPGWQQNERYDLVYANVSGTGHPDSLKLSAQGVAKAPEAGSVLVVDTDKSEVLKAPDEGYAINWAPNESGSRNLTVTYPISSTEWKEGQYLFLDFSFKDGSGKEHPIQLNQNGGVSESMSNGDGTAYTLVRLEKSDYPQPLTFKVKEAPGWTEDEQEIKLK
ncbi:hypothetical protein CDO73_22475 [Saccharibacillus sp. O23]|uniref:hypothetical protein n=1 Tax=Saccharibacillus sp. O23 TaxID=2009338 RepID=UPI000B4DFB5B|nr:hypothetical protein [Saccharibacillus sp. O23]OWR27389.1 hypothetical protein CDO73_22475 [Saccharibacillus sp. O23]